MVDDDDDDDDGAAAEQAARLRQRREAQINANLRIAGIAAITFQRYHIECAAYIVETDAFEKYSGT